jgi:hypothetical protein
MRKFAIAFMVVLCGLSTEKLSAQIDTPQIFQVLPTQNQLNISANSNISATFNIDMDAA